MKKKHPVQKDTGIELRDVILGGQDGLVNVLGVILAVATAVHDVRIVIIAGLAATFAESISMAAVAYTSMQAAGDYYKSEISKHKALIKRRPSFGKNSIRKIYYGQGFRGILLERIVKHVTRDDKLWAKTLVKEGMDMSGGEYKNPVRDAILVGVSATVGSLVPLLPFLFMDVQSGIVWSFALSTIVLFATGVWKGIMTTGHAIRSGLLLATIGIAAALIGYLVGSVLGVALYA